jgi:Fur family peroxide stress response transcriptional regulator
VKSGKSMVSLKTPRIISRIYPEGNFLASAPVQNKTGRMQIAIDKKNLDETMSHYGRRTMKCIPAMSKVKKMQREEEFWHFCRANRIPCTAQRRAVLRAVLELGSHPTADEVHASAPVRDAGVSRATVYRTLENLVQLGAIIKVNHGRSAIRYDGRAEVHHHFVCLRCNEIIDVASPALDAICIPDAGKSEFVVKSFNVQLSGLCRRCLTDKQ